MNRLAALDRLIITSAVITVARMPKRCMAAAAKGPVRPNRKMPVAAAKLMVWRDQPKACPQGTIKHAGSGAQSRRRQQRHENNSDDGQGVMTPEENALHDLVYKAKR